MALPERADLPRYVAPLPSRLEDLALRLAWPIVAVNLVGTAFGFWYYRFQFADTPVAMWPLVPDSPTATLWAALALAAWKLDAPAAVRNTLGALALVGCLKLGGWTPFVLTAFADSFLASTPLPLYAFLFTSHCAMVLQAFLFHRVVSFRVRAVAVAVGFYLLNDVVDYFVPVLDGPHHSYVPAEWAGTGYDHALPAHDLAAGGAVVLTVLGTFLALATRVKTLEAAERQ